MSKHTAGPWAVLPATRVRPALIVGPTDDGDEIGTIREDDYLGGEEAAANARLIAAAPELLEACQSMDADLNDPGCWIGALMSPNPKTVDLIRAAIAKATGDV